MVKFHPEGSPKPEKFRLVGTEALLALIGLQAQLGVESGNTRQLRADISRDDPRAVVYRLMMPDVSRTSKGYTGRTVEKSDGWIGCRYTGVMAGAIESGIGRIAQLERHTLGDGYAAIGQKAIEQLRSPQQAVQANA